MTPPGAPLFAVAHGSSDPRAAETAQQLMQAARRRRPQLDVRAAFLDHDGPHLPDHLGTSTGPVVVVPLLLTAAYHSKVDLPLVLTEELGRQPELTVHYDGATLGPDQLLLDALERRLQQAGVAVHDPDTAVVLAAAGSTDPTAVAAVEQLAADWAQRGWWGVGAAYASSATPSAGDAVAALLARGAPRVVVATYFLASGRLPDAVRAAALAAGAEVVSEPLGVTPEVVEVLLARYDAACLVPPFRPGAAVVGA